MNVIVKDKNKEYSGKIWEENNTKLHIQFDIHHWTVNLRRFKNFMSGLEANKLQYFDVGSKRYEIRKETF